MKMYYNDHNQVNLYITFLFTFVMLLWKNKIFFVVLFIILSIVYKFFQNIPFDSLILSLFHPDLPTYGKPLSIYVDKVNSKWNSAVTKCLGCSCTFDEPNSLEPLIHCILLKSSYANQVSKQESTFIFLPIYTNNIRNVSKDEVPKNLLRVVDEIYFKKWKAAHFIQVDSLTSFDNKLNSINDLDESIDQHIFITTNLTIEMIRNNRWMNSRHILVPPLQFLDSYPSLTKVRDFLFIGNSQKIKELFHITNSSNMGESKIIETIDLTKENMKNLIEEISQTKFVVFQPNEKILPFFIYEILRSNSIPIMLSPPFLPAYANTHINYTKISIRIPPSDNFIDVFKEKVFKFKTEEALNEISNIKEYLMWPKDGIIKSNNAAGVLIDYLNTRHRVLRPILRRHFFGSQKPLP